jgi:hypothetical protein
MQSPGSNDDKTDRDVKFMLTVTRSLSLHKKFLLVQFCELFTGVKFIFVSMQKDCC